jgi:hypothetical protein
MPIVLGGVNDSRTNAKWFIVVAKKTFRLRNAFFVTTLMPPSFFRNIIMTIGIKPNHGYALCGCIIENFRNTVYMAPVGY